MAAPATGISADNEAGRPRILVVDDEPTIGAIVVKALGRERFHIEVIASAPLALERLQAAHFDLLITDINMPELDGLTLAERAREQQAMLGIVVMSAYGSVDNMARAIHAGVADFITKPFELQEMRLAVTRALERQRLQRDNVRLQTLVQILSYTQAIGGTLELRELCEVVVDLLRRETGAWAAVVWTADLAGELRCADCADLEPHLVEQLRSLALDAFASGAETLREAGKPELPAERWSLVGMPLLAQGEALGALTVVYGANAQVVTELIGIIANQTALAVRNARQFEAVRELDRLKSEFIGIASHELRTPLSLVLGYSSLLRSRLAGRDRENLQQIIDGALRIGDIVDDLVHLRRSELRQERLRVSRFDLWVLLREIVDELLPLAATRLIDLRLDCPSASTTLVADREKLSLALAHLVDNATKFTDHGGVVRVVGRAAEAEPFATIEIRDSGLGIAAHDLSRIFDRFYQAAPSATRSRSGLGIGLALAKMLIELHGGEIQVHSKLGAGSVFEVRLPLEASADTTIRETEGA